MPKPTLLSVLNGLGFHIKSIFLWVDGMSPEQACAKISQMTGNKVNTSPPTVIKMFQKALEAKQIQHSPIKILPKQKKPRGNPDFKGKKSTREKMTEAGFDLKPIFDAMAGLTPEQAEKKFADLTENKFTPGAVTIIKMIEQAIESGELSDQILNIPQKGNRGRESVRSRLEKLGYKMPNIFSMISGMSPENAAKKIEDHTDGKLKPAGQSILRMVEQAMEAGELSENILVYNHRKPKDPSDTETEAPKDLYAATFICTECSQKRNEVIDAWASCNKHVVLGLVARKCHGCGKFGTLKARVKVGDDIVTKALIDGNEQFVDAEMNTIDNPLIIKKEIVTA